MRKDHKKKYAIATATSR